MSSVAYRVRADGREAVARDFRAGELELTQLSSGSVMTHGATVPLAGVWLTAARAGLPLIVRGRAPSAHATLLIADSMSPSARLGVRPFGGQRVAVVGCGAEIDLFLPAGCQLIAVSIADRFDRLVQFTGGSLPPSQGWVVVIRPAASALASLVRLVCRITSESTIESRPASSPGVRSRLRNTVLAATRRAIADASPLGDIDAVPLRQRATMVARDALRGWLSRPISLPELCGVAQARARTLEYGFREIYGVAPIAYIRCERLCRVRDALVQGDRASTSVTETATRWGFAHMSQFAKDYRTLFGECPSATLLAQRCASGKASRLPMQRPRC